MGSIPGPYLVTRTSINFLLFRPIFKFGPKFYILWANLYAQPQNFIWGLKYRNRVLTGGVHTKKRVGYLPFKTLYDECLRGKLLRSSKLKINFFDAGEMLNRLTTRGAHCWKEAQQQYFEIDSPFVISSSLAACVSQQWHYQKDLGQWKGFCGL